SKALGLCLRVSATGVRSWCYHYTRYGRRVRLTLGTFPATSLAAARSLAVQARGAVEAGEDPKNVIVGPSGAMTVRTCFERYLAEHVRPNLRTAPEIERRVCRNVLPIIGSVSLTAMRRQDVSRTLRPIIERGSLVEANLVLADLSSMLGWAV